MDNIKPWQIILFVVAIAALSFSVIKFGFGDSIPQTKGYMTVDIMTGQLYDVRKGKAKGVPLPAKHPDTGKYTLYPVNQVDGLTWEIPGNYETYLNEGTRRGSVLKDSRLTITVLEDDPIVFTLR